jgi:hypothetical protein
MASRSKQKGDRRERQVVALLKGMGLPAARVPLSGAAGGDYSSDVDFSVGGRPRKAEVKARAGGTGFRLIEKWLAGNDALFLIRDGQRPLVVLPWEFFEDLVRGAHG